jgi:hypothetical protein
MKHKLVRALAVVALAVSGSAVAAAPAHASELGGGVCITNQNTWLRDQPWGGVLRTLSAGRGFRVHGGMIDDVLGSWYYGHGAEATWQDGWIPAGNCNF